MYHVEAQAMTSGDHAVTNALSFDLEHWYMATLLRDEVATPTDHIRESVDITLRMLRRRGVQATFFTVGEVARDYPDVIDRVAAAGHEVASHGHTHTPLSELTPDQFGAELDRSNEAIADATGERPVGFRAPNFSVTRRTDWGIDVLRSRDFRYDSSVFPVRTPMYGVGDAPIYPYVPHPDNPFKPDRSPPDDGLLEVPLAVFGSKFRVPIAGGFYARLFPPSVLKRGIRNLNSYDLPAVLYFHPWEFNPSVVVDDVPWHKRFVSFHGIERLEARLDRLLQSFEFAPLEQIIHDD